MAHVIYSVLDWHSGDSENKREQCEPHLHGVGYIYLYPI